MPCLQLCVCACMCVCVCVLFSSSGLVVPFSLCCSGVTCGSLSLENGNLSGSCDGTFGAHCCCFRLSTPHCEHQQSAAPTPSHIPTLVNAIFAFCACVWVYALQATSAPTRSATPGLSSQTLAQLGRGSVSSSAALVAGLDLPGPVMVR